MLQARNRKHKSGIEMEKPEENYSIGTDSPSKTYKAWTFCGDLYITFTYKEDNKIDYVLISGGNQEHSCGTSFLTCLADFLTFSIRRIRNEHEARAIIKNLLFHRCDKMVANKNHITSCVDSIGKILKKELGIKD